MKLQYNGTDLDDTKDNCPECGEPLDGNTSQQTDDDDKPTSDYQCDACGADFVAVAPEE